VHHARHRRGHAVRIAVERADSQRALHHAARVQHQGPGGEGHPAAGLAPVRGRQSLAARYSVDINDKGVDEARTWRQFCRVCFVPFCHGSPSAAYDPGRASVPRTAGIA
jgi:hypothetical protein